MQNHWSLVLEWNNCYELITVIPIIKMAGTFRCVHGVHLIYLVVCFNVSLFIRGFCHPTDNTSNATFSSFPKRSLSCKLHDYTQLDCSTRKLRDIPVFTDMETRVTTKLILQRNLLTELSGQPFMKFAALKELDLSRNTLANVSSTAFTGLFLLEELNLAYNGIHFIQYDSFRYLSHLRTLDVSWNSLTKINNKFQPSPFDRLTSLENLILAANHIDSLNEDTFENLHDLKKWT